MVAVLFLLIWALLLFGHNISNKETADTLIYIAMLVSGFGLGHEIGYYLAKHRKGG